jgi:hypothetical protein
MVPGLSGQWRTSSCFDSRAREWSEERRGNRWSEEEAWWGALHRLDRRARHPICHAMFDGSHRQDRDQYAGATCIVVDVQTLLALIVMLAIIRPIVMVVMATLLIMIVVMAMMDVTILIMLMDVKQNSRERSSRRRTGHAVGRGHGKHECHRPNEGNAASACSFEARQHAILCNLQDQQPYRDASKA